MFSMKKHIIYIILLGVLNACSTVGKEKMNICLSVEKENGKELIILTIQNNSNQSFYIPRLTSEVSDSFLIANSGQSFSYIDYLFNYHFNSPPPIDGRCNISGEKISCFSSPAEYKCPPFTENKKLVSDLLMEEYRSVFKGREYIRGLSENDIEIIYNMVCLQYMSFTFISKGEEFKISFDIDSLLGSKEDYSFQLRYTPTIEQDYWYVLEHGMDSLPIPSKWIDEFGGYKCYSERLVSNVLHIPAKGN